MPFSLTNMTRTRTPTLPLTALAQKVLGARYDLSIALVGDRRARVLNQRYRGKNKPANVLSFPLGEQAGEIVLNLALARRDAPRFSLSYRSMVAKLFIHGLLHLNGLAHGRRMDTLEQRLIKQYVSSSVTRHRH